VHKGRWSAWAAWALVLVLVRLNSTGNREHGTPPRLAPSCCRTFSSDRLHDAVLHGAAPTATPAATPTGDAKVTGTPVPPAPTPTASTAACARVGFFVTDENPDAVTALASRLDVTANILSVYAAQPGYTSVTWLPTTSLQLLLGVGAVTPAQATSIGEYLVATGHANAIIRIMWEMNGNWFPWGTQALSAAEYIRIFRAAVTAFRAVPGNRFQYVWNLNAGSVEPGRTEFDTYPGNAYVSNVGIDWYDKNGGMGAAASTIPPILQFSVDVGRPVSFDEWGVDGVANAAPYIDYLANVVHDPSYDVAFQCYFSSASSSILQFPEAVAEYQKDFGHGC
jgi:hypothetical protein